MRYNRNEVIKNEKIKNKTKKKGIQTMSNMPKLTEEECALLLFFLQWNKEQQDGRPLVFLNHANGSQTITNCLDLPAYLRSRLTPEERADVDRHWAEVRADEERRKRKASEQ
jgi:hypothetical protein